MFQTKVVNLQEVSLTLDHFWEQETTRI